MTHPTARAAIAAGLIGLGYAEGGWIGSLAALALAAILLHPGPDGTSLIVGLSNWVSDKLKGGQDGR